MAKQMDPSDLAGIVIFFSKRKPSESPVFISYCGKKEWKSNYRPDFSLLRNGEEFANYMMNIQNQASPDNINKNFEIYPKDLKVDIYTIAKMKPSLALIDIDEKEADPQNLGLLAMLCATSKNGFSVPKEIMERFDVDFRCMSLLVGMEEYKTQFYPHSTSKKLREVQEKMREFMDIPAEMLDDYIEE